MLVSAASTVDSNGTLTHSDLIKYERFFFTQNLSFIMAVHIQRTYDLTDYIFDEGIYKVNCHDVVYCPHDD